MELKILESIVLQLGCLESRTRFRGRFLLPFGALYVRIVFASFVSSHPCKGRHYIPIKDSLEDLEEMAKFVMDPANQNLLKEIVYNANQWCSEHMLQDRLVYNQIELWEKYVRLLNKGNVDWQAIWRAKKDTMLRNGSEYGMVALG